MDSVVETGSPRSTECAPAMCALAGEKLHEDYPDAVFLAAALGCPFELTRMLAGCGFDFDLRQQQVVGLPPALVPRPIRRAAPYRAHGRLPARTTTRRGSPSKRASPSPRRSPHSTVPAILATLGIGCGTMMPMGFEFGCLEPLDPVTTTPESWERETRAPRVDLRDFIAAAHRVNAENSGLEPARPAAAGHGAQRAHCGSAALRQGLARLRHRRVDPPRQPRSRPERRAGLERAPDLGWRPVQHVPRTRHRSRNSISLSPLTERRNPSADAIPGPRKLPKPRKL